MQVTREVAFFLGEDGASMLVETIGAGIRRELGLDLRV